MEARLFVVVLFVCAVCHFTEAQPNITRTSCGSSKLCVSSPGNCDPSGSSSCFFSSIRRSTGVLTVEISGRTSGYVALGLTPTTNLTQPLIQGVTGVFVCGNNSPNTTYSSFFFKTAYPNGTQLVPYNMDALNITGIQGSVKENQSLIQCTFNITINSNLTQLPFNVTIFKGTTNGTQLGDATVVFSSFKSIDLADPTNNVKLFNITRNGCGRSKLCVSTASNCDPAGTSSCFFSSVQAKNQTFVVELSGTTTGYVALGLSKQGSTFVFACGNDSYNFFFQTATRNGTSLSPANVTTVYSYDGVVAQNQTLIQCIFNISTSLNISTKADDTTYNVTIMNGTTNGTVLGNATSLFSSGPLDLANPKSNIPVVLLNITRNGCGNTKLCFSSTSNCNTTGSSSCFFSSVQMKSQNFSFELSGTTTGYVALGLAKQNSTVVFICGNDTNGSDFFFETAVKNGTGLTLKNVTTVYSKQGVVAQSQALIQCFFNTTTSFNFSTKGEDTKYQVTIMNGTTNGTQLGDPVVQYDSKVAVDLSDPTALNSAVSLCTNVLAVLLSALTLRLL